MQTSKTNTILLVVLIILVLGIGFVLVNKNSNKIEVPAETLQEGEDKGVTEVKDTYIYTNHGFSIELPKGFVPTFSGEVGGPANTMDVPGGHLTYYPNASSRDDELRLNKNLPNLYVFIGDEKIGETVFKHYQTTKSKDNIYWYKRGAVGYEYIGNPEILKTFKFVGWPQVEGNKEDLVSFSIKPGQEVSGKMTATGSVGGYYFEGSFPITILDANKNTTAYGPGFATATSDWMTNKPVPFTANFDFSVMPKGNYYIKLMQDDPSGGESGLPVRFVIIPIVVK